MTIRPLPRSLLTLLAIVFAAWTVLYAVLWIFSASQPIPVELGFDNQYLPETHAQLVKAVQHDSPAESAGLKPGDRIVRIDGAALEADTLIRFWSQHKPGDSVDLSVARDGTASPIVLHGTFRASRELSNEAGVVQHFGKGINNLFPVVFVVVGLAVLFLRLDDPNAWLVALMFAGFIAIPDFANDFLGVPPSLRTLASAYHAIFNKTVAPIFFFFCATFPSRSPVDRRIPWLKWAAVGSGLVLALPELLAGPNAGPGPAGRLAGKTGHLAVLCFIYGLLVLGFISLIWNAATTTSSEARRKIRVILWGTLAGLIPATVIAGVNDFFGIKLSLFAGTLIILFLWLFPLSFAYAVVKHRVLEIPVLLRRSARYLLVKQGLRLTTIVVTVAALWFFVTVFLHFFHVETRSALPLLVGVGITVGALTTRINLYVRKRAMERIDRAFFRSAYDARVILEDLLEKTRRATDRAQLGDLLDRQVRQALHPSFVVVYLEGTDGQLRAISGDLPAEALAISRDEPLTHQLAEKGGPWEISTDRQSSVETQSATPLIRLGAECLVPILGRDNRLAGLIVLGPRLSEEPYSREDKQLLSSVANQTSAALENIHLAEQVAERIEAQRRTEQEMEFARQVQARLFPQKLVTMKTLDYAGGCAPARTVGGDYYDFLEEAPGRLGLVVADIAGKGVPGALLMASLQANLRSQYATAVLDLPRLLASVNRLFHQTTDDASYATLFFADYDDSTRRLRYANCGHVPALLLRTDGAQQDGIQWLTSTSTVLGLFADWQSQIAEVALHPGDTLVLYSDGVTEAVAANGEEFGEKRLVEVLKSCLRSPVPEILDSVVNEVRRFGGSEQQDDITLVVARCV